MRRYLRPPAAEGEPDAVAPTAVAAGLTLYSRHHCHLCDELLAKLRAHGYDAEVIDVDGDPALRERYGLAVPVLCQGGAEICRYHLDVARLQAHLAASS